jgi:SAM-dependent methyltransferase
MSRLSVMSLRAGLQATRRRRMRRRGGEDLPVPPVELRELVGPTDAALFDNPTGDPVFPDLDANSYRFVVDFGCGCGRIARQLAQQRERPERYVGVDLHRGMIRWCKENLGPRISGFEFHHHDVYNASFNPDPALPRVAPIPVDTGQATLVVAWSVFTHLLQSQVEWYLEELHRILADDGVAMSTWFLFDKGGFPMMQDFQNALYINEDDLTNAVIFDKEWLLAVFRQQGLSVCAAVKPAIRGYAWVLQLSPARSGEQSVSLPCDDAPLGRMPPPIGRRGLDC